MTSSRFIVALTLTAVFLAAGSGVYADTEAKTPVYGYKVVNTYPHNEKSFTQGLLIDKGVLYESTGIRGRSSLSVVDLKTGEAIRSRELPPRYFGEGLASDGDNLVQLTWTSRTGFVYDRESLKQIKTFKYDTEGWGITFDGKYLVMSDGSATLRFLDPHTFRVRGELEVYSEDGPVKRLNELEYIDGEIWANVWGSDVIARINPATGRVTGWVDLGGLLPQSERKGHEDVLNGIAYDRENKRLFVTGKYWPKLFEIEVAPPE